MRNRNAILAAALAAMAWEGTASAAISVNGSYDADYGTPLALQTNNSGFGNNTNTDGNTANGNELDGAYGVVQNGNLHVLFTGNVATDFTHLNVFIADGRNGQNTINAQTGGAGNQLAAMNGSKFSPGFNATYALDINGGNTPTTWFCNRWDFTQTLAPASFIGQFNPTPGAGSEFINGAVHSGVLASFNNSNIDGVSGDAGTTTLGADPAAVQTGFELAIPLSQLGSPRNTTLKILVDINGGGDGFLSNQFLPGLPPGSANIGNGGKFDFSAVSNFWLNVVVPPGANVDGISALAGGGSWGGSSSWTGGTPALAGDSATFGPAITGPATVTLDGSRTVGQITFNNANSYTIAAGTGGTLTINDATDATGVNPLITVSAGTHTILANTALAAGVTVNAADNSGLNISGTISGTGPIIKTGGGTLALAANNTYSGSTLIYGGLVELGSSAAASTGTIELGDQTSDNQAASLRLANAGMTIANVITTNVDQTGTDNQRTIAGAYSSGSSTLSGTINVNGGVVFSTLPGTTLNVNGIVQDGADTQGQARRSVHVAGGGTVVLSASESYSGNTFVDLGNLVIAPTGVVNTASLSVATGATLNVNGKLTVAGQQSVGSMNFAQTVDTLNIGAGGLVTMAPSVSAGFPTILQVANLNFANNTAKLDIGNNRLTTQSTLSAIRSKIAGGSLITTAPGLSVGYVDSGGGVIDARGVFGGDANLDLLVDTADFSTLATNFNQTGLFWQDGDFNYDGTVNALDFNALAVHFGAVLPAPALGTLVPEPSSVALVALGALVGRRRRR